MEGCSQLNALRSQSFPKGSSLWNNIIKGIHGMEILLSSATLNCLTLWISFKIKQDYSSLISIIQDFKNFPLDQEDKIAWLGKRNHSSYLVSTSYELLHRQSEDLPPKKRKGFSFPIGVHSVKLGKSLFPISFCPAESLCSCSFNDPALYDPEELSFLSSLNLLPIPSPLKSPSFPPPSSSSPSLFFDGASKGNLGLSGGGGMVLVAGSKLYFSYACGLRISSNNEAKFSALLLGLKLALHLELNSLVIFEDSKLVISAPSGASSVQNLSLKSLLKESLFLVSLFHSISWVHVPRSMNSKVDQLENKDPMASHHINSLKIEREMEDLKERLSTREINFRSLVDELKEELKEMKKPEESSREDDSMDTEWLEDSSDTSKKHND
eukprot:Gb_03943 [translate_table: standard]